MKYVFLCDIDKTFMPDTYILDENAIEQIKKINENNKIILLSNSSSEEIESMLKNVYVDYVSITSSIIRKNNKYIYNLIDKSIINQILNKFSDYIYTAYTSFNDVGFIYNYQQRLNAMYPKNNINSNILSFDTTSIMIVIQNEIKDEFVKELDNYNLFYTSYGKDKNREIFKVEKKHRTKKSCSLIAKEDYPDSIFVGISDSIDDLDFISICDIKVAMKNGDIELKEKADYITKYDNNQFGAISFMYNLINQ